MSAGERLTVVFRVAAGPRVGFGHLVRCRSLASALEVSPLVSLRGTNQTRERAASMGFTFFTGEHPDLVVVDDPDGAAAGAWVRKARRMGVPVASIHDLGLAHVESDLVIDGSIGAAGDLHGQQFAILDPAIAGLRREARQPQPGRVLVALGGGSHVLTLAGRLSRAIAERSPAAAIRVVRGFAAGRPLPALRHASWVEAPDGLGHELADAQVAVVAGGVTLFEACALGIPVVALPVTLAQHAAVRAVACRGAAIDVGRPPVDDGMVSRTADAVAALLQHDGMRQRQSAAAWQLVDGLGAFRVAERLKQLAAASGRTRHAA